MEWTELILQVAIADLEKATDIMQMAAPMGFYVEDYSNFEEEVKDFGPVEIIEEELLQKDKTVALIHYYIEPDENPAEAVAFLQERFSVETISYTLDTKKIQEEDWANNWKKYFKPVEVGNNLVIKPTWEAYENTQNKVVVEIDPSMSFGSGQHETTRLCMAMLEPYVKADTRMLDVGTGSGILAVEALLLGAESVEAVDIDPLSVRVAKENATLNGVAERLDVKQSDLTKDVTGTYNLITANIVADIIIRLLEDIDRILEVDGTLIASGIIDVREADVVKALEAKGYAVTETRYERGWVALAARKASSL